MASAAFTPFELPNVVRANPDYWIVARAQTEVFLLVYDHAWQIAAAQVSSPVANDPAAMLQELLDHYDFLVSSFSRPILLVDSR